jgi:hypothetical protein
MPYSQEDAVYLVNALRMGRVDRVRERLLPAEINLPVGENVKGATALHLAVQYGQIEVCNLLLALGADPNIRAEGTGEFALHAVMGSGVFDEPLDQQRRAECIKAMLVHGADPNVSRDREGWTPLHLAVNALSIYSNPNVAASVSERVGHTLELIRSLIAAGGDPEFVTTRISGDALSRYLTPFQYAVDRGVTGAVSLFIDECAVDLGRRTAAGRTLAQVSTSPEMRALLRAAKTERGVISRVKADDKNPSEAAPRSRLEPGIL